MSTNLQDEIYAWHQQNYPTDDVYAALLGVGEELGELDRAQLKQDGKIRGTFEHWQEEKCKEVGDVFIGLLNLCGHLHERSGTLENNRLQRQDFPRSSCPLVAASEQRKILLSVSISFGNLTNRILCQAATVGFEIGSMYRDLELYCLMNNFDPDQVLVDRWTTISKRDFITNPESGGREMEA